MFSAAAKEGRLPAAMLGLVYSLPISHVFSTHSVFTAALTTPFGEKLSDVYSSLTE